MGTEEPTPAADPDPAHDEHSGDEHAEEDTRRRFREALARKQGRAHLGGTTSTATPHPHAAPAKRGRTFRRKSG